MADRYWWPSGGTGSSTGNWNSTTNWSSSSASYVSASVPTTADNVNFGSYSGASSFTVTVTTGSACLNLAIDNANMILAGTGSFTVNGSIAITTLGSRTFTGNITFGGTGTKTVNFGGVQMASLMNFNNASGDWNLGSALTSTNQITITAGTFSTANYNVTCSNFASNNTNVRTINLGSSTIIATSTGAAWNTLTPTNLTLNAGTSTISVTSASAKTFNGGGKSFYNLNQGGAGALTITGANTFNNITNSVRPTTVTFPASTTNTFANFNLNGTTGNLVTINSSTVGNPAFLVKSGGGQVSCDYLFIRDISATPTTNTWYAGANSTNASGNSGWIFSAIPISQNTGAFLIFLKR